MDFPIISTRYEHVNKFVNELAPIVCELMIEASVNNEWIPTFSTCLAQAGCESGWDLGAKTLFGIKGDGEVLPTQEYINGEYVDVYDSFASYPDLASAVRGYIDLMQWDNYDPATHTMEYHECCRAMQNCGYATSPTYADTLISIIDDFGLDVFDEYGYGRIDEIRDEIYGNNDDEPASSDIDVDDIIDDVNAAVDEVLRRRLS